LRTRIAGYHQHISSRYLKPPSCSGDMIRIEHATSTKTRRSSGPTTTPAPVLPASTLQRGPSGAPGTAGREEGVDGIASAMPEQILDFRDKCSGERYRRVGCPGNGYLSEAWNPLFQDRCFLR